MWFYSHRDLKDEYEQYKQIMLTFKYSYENEHRRCFLENTRY